MHGANLPYIVPLTYLGELSTRPIPSLPCFQALWTLRAYLFARTVLSGSYNSDRVGRGWSMRCSLLCLVLFPCGARLHRIFCLFACTAVYGHLRVLWGRVTPTVTFHRALGVDLAMTANYTVSGLRPDELFELEKGRVVRGINFFCQPVHLAL